MIELYSKQASSSGTVIPPPWGNTGSIILSDGKEYGYVFPVINDQVTFDQYMTTDAYYYAPHYPYKAFNRGAEHIWHMQNGRGLYTFDFKESVYINALRNLARVVASSNRSTLRITYHFEDGATYDHTPYFSEVWEEHIFTDPRFYSQKVTKFTIQWVSGGNLPTIDELQFLYLK